MFHAKLDKIYCGLKLWVLPFPPFPFTYANWSRVQLSNRLWNILDTTLFCHVLNLHIDNSTALKLHC